VKELILDPLTVAATLHHAARNWPDRPALIIGDRTASYEGLWNEASVCARALIAHGIRPGDNVGIYLPNRWDYVLLFLGITMAGATAVALNARFREHEILFALGKADVAAIFTGSSPDGHFDGRGTLERAAPNLADALPALRLRVDLDSDMPADWTGWCAFLERAGSTAAGELADRLSAVRAGDDCLIMFSSGTTANPKACRLSHRALTISAAGQARRFHLRPDDVFWDPLPFFHMSTMLPLAACRLTGACFVGIEHFEPGAALEELERTGATVAYPAFSTITAAMISHPDFVRRDLSAIRLTLNVGPVDVLRKFQGAFPQASQVSCYGLTECGGLSFYNEPSEPLEQRLRTVGTPIEGVEVRIASSIDGVALAPGEAGEIQLRGTTLFSGYYGDANLTEAAMSPDGWLRTGDIGMLDPDGRLTYIGRVKDMLRVGGENVAAAEIESFLATHPAIKIAQVVGVPDDRLEEVPAAFVELEPGAALNEVDVARFCAHRIANYKIPRYVRFVTEWPMSATKIQKFQLREAFAAERKMDIARVLRETPRA
jgi:acyl-CoA synthetase (AMP-forming)/AMP-acid ligase II